MINARTTREHKQRLEEAADRAGRSLSQEVEARLDASLFYFGQGDTLDIMVMLAKAKHRAEHVALRRGLSDEEVRLSGLFAIMDMSHYLIHLEADRQGILARGNMDPVSEWKSPLDRLAEAEDLFPTGHDRPGRKDAA